MRRQLTEDDLAQVPQREVRPEVLHKTDLAVLRLEQHEVAQAVLVARPNQNVRLKARRIELRLQLVHRELAFGML